MTSDEPDRVRVFTAAIAAAAALAIGAGGATAHAAPAKPVIHSVHVKASPTQRLVAISTVGRPFQHVAVCDLRATTCVTAGRAGRNEWRAVLPAQEPDGHYRIGVIARSGRDYVTKSFGNAEAAEPFMP
jgi:hypothetical protein